MPPSANFPAHQIRYVDDLRRIDAWHHQAQRKTPATDIYALGVVIYEMVTGELPFKGDSNLIVALKHLNEEPKPPRDLNPNLELRWQGMILSCLKKASEERFQSAQEVREALDGNGKPRKRVGRKLVGWRVPFAMTMAGFVVALIFLLVIVNPAMKGRMRSALHSNGSARVAPAFAERDRILLTDFENETGDRSFDRTVRDLLGQALSQSSYVNVVPRLTAVDAARRTGTLDPTKIDANLGRQICIRENYRAMLTGSVRPSGSGFRIDAQVEDPRNDQVLVADSETIHSPDQLYEALV